MACAMNAAVEKDAAGKLPPLLQECSRMGIAVHGPDINRSMHGFTVIDGELYYGLGTVKGVKENAGKILQERGIGYSGYKDFLLRLKVNRTVVKNLIMSGTFDSLHKARGCLVSCLDDMLDMRNEVLSLKEKEEKLSRDLEQETLTGKERKRKEAQLAADKEKLHVRQKEWEEYILPNTHDTVKEKLEFEKNTLFAYITTHPMDAYDERPGCVCLGNFDIKDVGTKNVLVMGCIIGMKVVRSKKDNREMAIFTLQDKTGEQKCICFSSRYEKCREHLKEGCVVSVYCNVSTEKDDKESIMLVVNDVEMMEPDLSPVVLSVKEAERDLVKEKVAAYLVEQGHPLLLYIRDGEHAGLLVKSGIYVHHTITDGFPKEEVLMAKIRKRRKKYGTKNGRYSA